MAQADYVHVSHVEFSVDASIPGYIEHVEERRVPPSFAVPVIAGLSGALWAVLWFAGRCVIGF